MGCDDREHDAGHDARMDCLDEAIRIRKRLAQHPSRLGMFSTEDAILILHLFREGETETPTIEQLERLHLIEKNFFVEYHH